MATLTIESFPDALHARLREAAERQQTPVDEFAVALIAQSLSVQTSSRGKPLKFWEDLPEPIKPLKPVDPEFVVRTIRELRDSPP